MKEFIDKLIERLEELKELHAELIKDGLEEDYHSGCEGMCVDIIEIVNQLAEEYKGGWIPCSERLPEEYTEVLGYGLDGHIYMVELYNTEIYGKVWKQWNGGDIRLKFIDAWMPLPAPFKDGE
jgi:hypothetical protein